MPLRPITARMVVRMAWATGVYRSAQMRPSISGAKRSRLRTSGWLLLTVACGIGLLATAHAQATIPAALTDRQFWDLIGSLSEPDGAFEDENYVSNELGYQRTMERLQKTVAPGGVFIGVGPEQNFHYVAALRPSIAFVIDIRRQNAVQHLMYKALFEIATDRVDFVSRLFSRPRPTTLSPEADVDVIFRAYETVAPDERLFTTTLQAMEQVLMEKHGFPLDAKDRSALAKVFTAFRDAGPRLMYVFRGTTEPHPTYAAMMTAKDEAGRNWSYLSSTERFEHVRAAQRQNLIVPVVGDFAGPKALKAIGEFLRSRNARVSLFYVSNVEPYLFTARSADKFYDNVLSIPFTDEALFVRTFFGSTTRECKALGPTIRTPVISRVRPVLDAYRAGTLTTQCELVKLSRIE